jgi:hypothetical protein
MTQTATAFPNSQSNQQQVERLVRASGAFLVYKAGQGQACDDHNALAWWAIDKTVERILATGECVWHASSVVLQRPCACHDCKESK